MFSLPRRHLRQRRPSHPSDPVLHRRRCAEAHGTRESHQSCHALGVRAEARSRACRAGLSTPTCDPWSQSLASFTPTRNSRAQSHASFVDIEINKVDPLSKGRVRVSCSHQERLNLVTSGAVMTSATTRKSDFRTCTSATSTTSTGNARSLPNVSVIQPSHSAAQCCQPCKLRRLATKRSATMRGVDTSSGQLRLCRGSSKSCVWCPGRLVSALMFTPHEHSCLRGKWLDNHTQDHGRSQMHMCRRHGNNYNNRDCIETD